LGYCFFSSLQAVSSQTPKASNLAEIEKQISALEQQRSELSVRYSSGYPKIKEPNQQITDLQKQRSELLKPSFSASEAELFTRITGARATLQSCVLTSSPQVCQNALQCGNEYLGACLEIKN
jgi:uncharacterized protein involved in exopolysaccharide biosynthesis